MRNQNDVDNKNSGALHAKRKNRVFAPVTIKMIQDASPRADEVCEIDGEAINDVSIRLIWNYNYVLFSFR